MVSKESTTFSKRIQNKGRGVQIVSKTKTHYTSDGKPYKGETHKTGAVLMTGAKHTPTSKVLTHTPPKKK
jgi:hypothetical protein